MKSYLAVCIALILTASILLCQAYPAEAMNTTITRYAVTSKGFKIGTVITSQHLSRSNESTYIRFKTTTSVKASFLWLGYHLDTTEEGVVRDGTLVEYRRNGEDNGNEIEVEGRLDGATFRFQHLEKGNRRAVVIPRTSYDVTTMECPEVLLDFTGRDTITLRILDVEHLQVFKRQYRLIENGTCSVAGIEYPCRVIDFNDQNKSARRWIGTQGNTVVMYRQDGRGKTGYSVRAVTVRRQDVPE